MFEILSNFKKMMDINHHSENILQAPSSFTKDKLSDSARFSSFFKKQMKIDDEQKLAVGSSTLLQAVPDTEASLTLADPPLHPALHPGMLICKDNSFLAFRWGLVNGRQKQR